MQAAAVLYVEHNDMQGLELLRKRIRDRLAKLNMSANESSRRAGLGISYVNDLLAGKSKNPVSHRLEKLAQVLDCDLEYLTGEQDSPRSNLKVVREPEIQLSSHEPIPLYSVGLPDADSFFKIDENNPPLNRGALNFFVPSTYAVVVPDDSNAPRYFAGEYVIAHPGRPVSRGGFAVIRMKDGRATICRVDAIMSDRVAVSRLEGGASVLVPRDEIEAVHRIIGSAELT